MKRERALLLSLLLVLILIACQSTPGAAPPTPPGAAPRLFIQPDDSRAPLLQLLQGATHRVDLTIYLLTDETIVQALEDAAARGVQVRVLMEGEPFGGGKNNRRTAKRLQQAGVDVRFSSPAFRYTHQKSLVVDGTTGVIMTMNLTYSSFTRNREYGVILHDPALVEEMRTVFAADWDRTVPALPDPPRLVWSPINARERILALIRSARTRLDLEHQDLIDGEVVAALVQAAQRGVRVRLIRPTPGDQEAAEWGNIRRLIRAGGEVRLLDSPRVHAKVIVADRTRALIGSMNLTPTSLDFNRELGVELTAPEVVQPLLKTMDQDWTRAVPVSPEAAPASEAIPPEEAGRYVGQVVTVEGRVVRTHDTGKVTFLDLEGPGGFSVVIFARDYDNFPKPPAQLYEGKRIRVRGRVKVYKGEPEIVVSYPDAIEVVR